jgi:hypothetical protein
MSLKYKFYRARKIIADLDPTGRSCLDRICRDVQAAEVDLQNAARPLLEICNNQCEGLCCRNIDPDSLISLGDMVYILALDADVSVKVQKALNKEKPFFTRNCIFLKNGVGPCMFRWDVRPEICITSFCFLETNIRKETARVKRRFFRLRLYIAFRKLGVFRLLSSPHWKSRNRE